MAMNNIVVSHRLSLGNLREEFSREAAKPAKKTNTGLIHFAPSRLRARICFVSGISGLGTVGWAMPTMSGIARPTFDSGSSGLR